MYSGKTTQEFQEYPSPIPSAGQKWRPDLWNSNEVWLNHKYQLSQLSVRCLITEFLIFLHVPVIFSTAVQFSGNNKYVFFMGPHPLVLPTVFES